MRKRLALRNCMSYTELNMHNVFTDHVQFAETFHSLSSNNINSTTKRHEEIKTFSTHLLQVIAMIRNDIHKRFTNLRLQR